MVDVTLVKGELSKALEAIRLSKSTFNKIVQNLFWAWFYNLAAIPVAPNDWCCCDDDKFTYPLLVIPYYLKRVKLGADRGSHHE